MPAVMAPFVADKVDQTGRIIDEKTRRKVAELLEAIVVWTRKLSSPQYAERGDYY